MKHGNPLLLYISLIGILTLWINNLLQFFYSQVLRSYNYPSNSLGGKFLTYQLVFALNFSLLMLLMKSASWWLNSKSRTSALMDFLFTTPYLSVRGRFINPPRRPSSLFLAFFGYCLSLVLVTKVFVPALFPLTWPKTILISPVILLLTETVGIIGESLARLFGKSIHPIHDHPLMAEDLGDFWGKRWNRWVQDWLRDVGRASRRKPLWFRLALVFFFSGLFHEVMINLPYWLCYRQSFFGTMMAYFLIQGLGLWVEKRYVYRTSPIVQRLYLWVLVLAPSPLFINTPILTFMGIKHD